MIPTPESDSPPSRTSRAVQKLQRAVVDGLEDVKAIDIQVFNTEALSPLFERVVVASGNSNRQTRALAASVIDQLREAGYTKPRVEGEDNGEWIVVDCDSVVVHIMQPAIRAYYRLEELWGAKPVRVRLGAAKSAAAIKKKAAGEDPTPDKAKKPVKTAGAGAAGSAEGPALSPAAPRVRRGAGAAAAAAGPNGGAGAGRRTPASKARSRAATSSAGVASASRSAAPRAAKVRTVVVGSPAGGKPAGKSASRRTRRGDAN